MSDEMTCRMVMFASSNGDEVQGYLARPVGDGKRGSVVVIHHLPGFDRGSHEITRRIAAMGFDALLVNLYWRQAPNAAPDDAAALVRAARGIPDRQVIDDVVGAAAYLRGLDTSNDRVGVIGFCSGGRHSVLVGCNADLDAVVDCYGAFVTGEPTKEFPLDVTNLVDQLPSLRAPLLGLFGNDDQFPSPQHVDELEARLTELGKTFECVRYDGAAHAFLNADRDSYRVDAALDAWERIAAFYRSNLEV